MLSSRDVYYELTDHFEVAADSERCWAFFSSAENLPVITPPWLKFTIAMPSPPAPSRAPAIAQDVTLDYTIRWLGVPIRWRTKIIDFSPPRQFIDFQVRGPYALWHHQHRFEEIEGRGGVSCFDRVIYRLPVPPLGRIVHAAVMRRQLLEIFRYRRKMIGRHLGLSRVVQDDVQIQPLR